MKFIENTKTKNDIAVDIWISETLSNTPVLSLVLRTFAELVDKKWCVSNVDIFKFGIKDHRLTKVVWAQLEDGTPIGGIYYKFNPDLGFAEILLSFTDPAYRGNDIHLLCSRYFENDCKQEGYYDLICSIHLDNVSSLKSHIDKIGFSSKFVLCHKKLSD